MRLFRPILSLVLILVTTLLVSCSSPSQAKIPTVYTPEKIAQLQPFREPVATAREQMETLKGFIQAENWTNTRTFIHGPLGQLRQDMNVLSRKLLVKDQKPAQDLAKELFGHFERIDAAAKDRNSVIAQSQYLEAVKDLEAFLNLVPSNS
ncbi:photosystem II protein PsbQ [Geminocystis sp. CENA526]|uniref:photosystem II protein PsbQ n=1 Tax=Geminocystis sp. CENA526 TaxID=1355871 RepID=UPI003D6EE33A